MKLKLMKFGAAWCPPCIAMEKLQTLEKFSAAHPDVSIKVHNDTEAGSKRFEEVADEWRVKNLPTLIWLFDDKELFRSSETSMTAIKAQYAKALKKAGLS